MTSEVRSSGAPGAASLRGDGRTLYGYFARFGEPTIIDSLTEGRFVERIAKGAFKRSIASGRPPKVLANHGHDVLTGNLPLGRIRELREDDQGAYYEVSLLEADYVERLRPALAEGLLGASFRFSVQADEWTKPRTQANGERLPERTLLDVDLYEFGPVTFPAYEGASAGLRSITDEWYDSLRSPLVASAFTERVGSNVARRELAGLKELDQKRAAAKRKQRARQIQLAAHQRRRP